MTLQTYVGQASDRLEVEIRQPVLQAMNAVESGEKYYRIAIGDS
ncbi:MAG: hypothetical protein V7K41_26475 [Nostoc sp.]